MRWFRPKWVVRRIFQAFFGAVLSILVLVALLVIVYSRLPAITVAPILYTPIRLVSLDQAPEKRIYVTNNERSNQDAAPSLSHLSERTGKRGSLVVQGGQFVSASAKVSGNGDYISAGSNKNNGRCSMYTCFDISRCGLLGQDSLTVYIYPVEKIFIDGRPVVEKISREFYQVIRAVRNSPYYVPDPSKACIFVPTIDLMNLQLFHSQNDIKKALSHLEFWGEAGENHLLFNFFPGSFPLTDISESAIVASSAFVPGSFRPGFHLPIISYNSFLGSAENLTTSDNFLGRKILAVSTQGFLKANQVDEDILVLKFCPHQPFNYSIRCAGGQIFHYPQVLMKTDFCLIPKDMAHPTLWDVMSVGCVPVIIIDFQRLPYDDLIDWRRNSILLYENQIGDLSAILRNISPERRRQLKSQVQLTFKKYLQTIDHITNTALEVIRNRIFLHSSHTVEQWNENPRNMAQRSFIFSPAVAARTPGFTAVILAYDRMPSLLRVIEQVATVPSLAKILVVWNNQMKKPPGALAWPKISKPIKIIQTEANKMSNRFFPYDEIETEAVFSLDDDIIMLTPDEMEFAFEAWLEFPDRVVGFPSRSHVWDNSSGRWKYDSEWTNEISMVLTGAAFYHKFWHYAYTYQLPREIREWVDAKMNCEDIAMNFLVSHHTGKAPIKVTPRKKFKCPTCLNNEMLSTDSGHMVERTDCINKFSQVYGYMPLLPVEFRADPVLFRVDNVPAEMKRFNDIGSL